MQQQPQALNGADGSFHVILVVNLSHERNVLRAIVETAEIRGMKLG